MTIGAATAFDIDAFKRGYEEWDIEALLGLYVDDVEVVQIDRDNPPSAPRIRQGKDVLRVVANGIFDIDNGRIARERDVVSGGPKAA